VRIDDKPWIRAATGLHRPDVALVQSVEGAAYSGFECVLDVSGLAPGSHRLSVHASNRSEDAEQTIAFEIESTR
jgi:hypothetical protein